VMAPLGTTSAGTEVFATWLEVTDVPGGMRATAVYTVAVGPSWPVAIVAMARTQTMAESVAKRRR